MIKIFIDAATNPTKQVSAGGMVLLHNQQQQQLHVPLKAINNHEAEFEMMIYALDYCLSHDFNKETIFIYSDSKIVIQSIDKTFAKKAQFATYLAKINTLLESFNLIFLEWIPEGKNKGADQLAKQGLKNSY